MLSNARLDYPSKDADFWQQEVGDISTDSRNLQTNSIFLAVDGEFRHGGEFIDSICDCIAILVDVDFRLENIKSQQIPIIVVKNLKYKLPIFVSWFFYFPSDELTVIGITGTNGKTSVLHYLAGFYHKLGKKVSVAGTLGYGLFQGKIKVNGLTSIGLIDFQRMLAQCVADNVEVVIAEVSSHAIVQGRVDGVSFSAKILTQITQDHLDYHKTLTCYQQAKLSFFNCGDGAIQIINSNDKLGRELVAHELPSVTSNNKNFCYANNPSKKWQEDLFAHCLEFDTQGIKVKVHERQFINDTKIEWIKTSLTIKFYGEYVIDNFLAAWLCFRIVENIPCKQIDTYATSLSNVQGRLDLISQKVNIFIDFAHTEDGLFKSLNSLKKHFVNYKIWVLFGAGGDRDKNKRPKMGMVANELADKIFLTDDNPRTENSQTIINEIMVGIKDKSKVKIILNRKDAIEFSVSMFLQMDTEKIVLLLAGKGHENSQIVGDEVLEFNEFSIVKRALENHNN